MILSPTLLLNAGSGAAIVRPTFSRDFAGEKTLNNGTGPAIAFTRADATTCATYFDANGVLQTAAANVPRFDHDPATGASRGLLIEESRQNLLQRSEEFDNAYWTKTSTTITANDATAPDGTTSADLAEKTGNDATTPARTVAVTAAAHTASVFVKNVSGDRFRIRIDATGGTVVDAIFNTATGAVSTSSAGVTASIQSVGNGWYRCVATYTFASAVNATIGFSPRNVDAVDSTGAKAYLWGAQLEAGAFATNYIPTTTVAVTRQADSAIVNPISSFYNQAEGTLFAEAVAGTTNGTASGIHQQTVVQLLENNTGDILAAIYRQNSTTNGAFFVGNSGTQADLSQAGFTAGTNARLAAAYKVNDFALSVNGAAATTDTSGSLPTATTLRIGRYGTSSGFLNGHIRRIAYWPRRLSNALLETLTT
jgi:hypothetical protein